MVVVVGEFKASQKDDIDVLDETFPHTGSN